MVAEMVPERELQPRAFSIMPLVWSLGSIFGPSFGGFFAKPVENLPGLFGKSKFLAEFPFALPNIVASMLFLMGISTGILFLKVCFVIMQYQSHTNTTRKPSKPNATEKTQVSTSEIVSPPSSKPSSASIQNPNRSAAPQAPTTNHLPLSSVRDHPQMVPNPPNSPPPSRPNQNQNQPSHAPPSSKYSPANPS